jgi:soluble cytochrome b562
MAGDYGTPDYQGDRTKPTVRKPHHLSPQSADSPLSASAQSADMASDQPNLPRSPSSLLDSPSELPNSSTPPRRRRRRQRQFGKLRLWLPRSWLFWGATAMIAFSGMGVLSATALLRLPSLPNCPAIFWPTASASLRMYCAQLAADKRTTKDLLRAISLVNSLPQDHPLRPEVNRNIEAWAKAILDLSEESFQVGKLDKAIETAKKIPANTAAHSLVETKIAHWETVWKKAEGIYNKAEEQLKTENLRQAFRTATQLLEVGNTYWETTKYREINNLIVQTRLDGSKIDKAKGLTDQGGLSNLLAAIKLVEEIKPESYLFMKAQEFISQIGRDMLDLAESALEQRDYDEALEITRQIPDKAKLQEEVRDFNMIAEAQSQAWNGTIPDLEAAIVAVQRIKHDRPLYGKAQQWVSTWQSEIQDVTKLERARQLAQAGTTEDLSAAIAEAEQIPFGNPRREQAEKEISQWQGQIETSEDQPYLDQAEQLASTGDLQGAINAASRIRPGRSLYDQASSLIDDWTAQVQRAQDQPQLDRARQLAAAGDLSGAISVARQIGSGRPLYEDAQAEISDWSGQMEQAQDRPYLDQARQLANQGNVGDAIAVANQISPERTLYDQAQDEIRRWRGQSQGQDQLSQAYNAARIGTPAMLGAAIEIAHQVPDSNSARSEADRVIDQWSYQLLQMAQTQAQLNQADAIAIAERIPAYAGAYETAQQQIRSWRQQ